MGAHAGGTVWIGFSVATWGPNDAYRISKELVLTETESSELASNVFHSTWTFMLVRVRMPTPHY